MTAKPNEWAPMRVRVKTKARATRIIAHVQRYGWNAIDAARSDTPSYNAVIDAALALLEKRLK